VQVVQVVESEQVMQFEIQTEQIFAPTVLVMLGVAKNPYLQVRQLVKSVF